MPELVAGGSAVAAIRRRPTDAHRTCSQLAATKYGYLPGPVLLASRRAPQRATADPYVPSGYCIAVAAAVRECLAPTPPREGTWQSASGQVAVLMP